MEEVEVELHAFFTSSLEDEWSASPLGPTIPGNELPHSLDRGLGGPQNRSGRRGEEKRNLNAPDGTLTSDVQPLA
jgi:hypothetical protein